jgi:translation initiation factor IF-2
MAHTVQTLSKLLKKTSDEVINILANAGIDGKTADSEISAEERKILMGSLSKRSTNKSSMSVSSRKPSAKSSASAGGIKVQVKKKRVKKEAVQEVGSVDNEEALKAQAALDSGRDADEKLLAQDAKRHEMTRLKKIKHKHKKTSKRPPNKKRKTKLLIKPQPLLKIKNQHAYTRPQATMGVDSCM